MPNLTGFFPTGESQYQPARTAGRNGGQSHYEFVHGSAADKEIDLTFGTLYGEKADEDGESEC